MISIENLEPIIVYDLKRNRSPNVNPISPERKSHNQLCTEASVGSSIPRLIKVKMLRNVNPATSLIILTGREPTLLLAYSNDNEVTVQKIAVINAASSPVCCPIKLKADGSFTINARQK